jgi:transglutaminase-like putative cysteine protease
MKNKLLSIVLLLLVLALICPACIITQNTTTGVTSSTTFVTTTRSTSTHLVSTTSITKTKSTSTPPVSNTVASLVISTQHLADGTMDSDYNFTLSAAGGVPPYTWSIESGNLPDGLKLDTSTGTITGIPAKSGGPTTLFFKVTDGNGAVKIKGLSVSIMLGDFQKIDEWALNVPVSSATSIKDLVTYLLGPCQTDMEKARVIYRWITANITYDEATGERIDAGIFTGNPDQNAEAVFSRRNAVCEGYSRLFKQMSDYAGLHVAYITGWGKVDYAYLSSAYYKKNHAWNAVQIDGTWHLLDSTWGAGDVDSFVMDFWFLTPPEQFVFTHCPDDAKWQLLENPYPASAIAQHPVVKPAFFRYGLQIGENDYPYYTVNNSLFLTIPTPPDAILIAAVFQNGQQLTGNYTFCQRKDDANYEVHARFPTAGKYDLKIYAKWQNESGDYPMAIIYQVITSHNLDMSEFPKQYDLFGARGAYLYTFVPGQVQSGTSYNYKISVPDAQEVAFITNVDGGSPVFHKLTKNGQIFEGTIDIVKGTMRISAKFPGDDLYWALLEFTGQ